MQLSNTSRPSAPIHLLECRTFWQKLLGLMGRIRLESTEGIALIIQPPGRFNAAIHMFFMRFDIAAIWLDADHKVIHKTIAHRWRPYYAPSSPAAIVLEIHPTRINDYNVGDQVKIAHA